MRAVGGAGCSRQRGRAVPVPGEGPVVDARAEGRARRAGARPDRAGRA